MRGFNLLKTKVSRAFKRMQPAKPPAPMEEDLTTKKIWRDSLYRLAAQRGMSEPVIEHGDPNGNQVSKFVDNLNQAVSAIDKREGANPPHEVLAVQSSDQDELPSQRFKPKRLGDRTITDMKSWWKGSLGNWDDHAREKYDVSELPGERKMLKRWFQ